MRLTFDADQCGQRKFIGVTREGKKGIVSGGLNEK
jgi:hypothetical protein